MLLYRMKFVKNIKFQVLICNAVAHCLLFINTRLTKMLRHVAKLYISLNVLAPFCNWFYHCIIYTLFNEFLM
jgi:hypothetical protein